MPGEVPYDGLTDANPVYPIVGDCRYHPRTQLLLTVITCDDPVVTAKRSAAQAQFDRIVSYMSYRIAWSSDMIYLA